MKDLYLIGFITLGVVMFIVGLAMLIRGYRRYDFHPLTFLVPLVGTAFCFPAYFMLKERYLSKSGAAEEAIKRTHRQMVLGLVFVIAIFIVPFVTGVCFFTQSFNAFDTSSPETLDIDGEAWVRGLFWSWFAVCALYAAAALVVGSRKRI